MIRTVLCFATNPDAATCEAYLQETIRFGLGYKTPFLYFCLSVLLNRFLMSPQVNTLLREAEQLDSRALDDFITGVISLRTRRSHPQPEEAALLAKINKGLSPNQIQRLRNLNQQRNETGLSETERAELLTLVEKSEQFTARRLTYLTVLARLRHVSVRELMQQLGIGPANG